MHLTELLECGIELQLSNKSGDPDIKGITDDSRKVKGGFAFAAIRGSAVDGTKYISDAINNGASAILTYPDVIVSEEYKNLIRHKNPRLALGYLAAKFFGKQPKCVAAVTGTNGKTSVADFTRQLWHLLGHKSASIGTIGIFQGFNEKMPTDYSLTTPGLVDLHKTMSDFAKNGTTHVVMEASSHGLDQDRMAGLNIKVGGFTNLSRDHLDYHATMEEYFAAKSKLFTSAMNKGSAVLNADIEEFSKLKKICKKYGHELIDFGYEGEVIKLKQCNSVSKGIEIGIDIDGKEFEITLPLYGSFQAGNVLCAMGMVMASTDNKIEDIVKCLSGLRPVRGRMEKAAETEVGAQIFVDYAHTPDALEKALDSLRGHLSEKGKLVVVFGCGGDRDRGKRPIMGKIASEKADYVIVTDDNPRTEDPVSIRKAILESCKGAIEIADRKEAISHGVKQLKNGDILLIAGKGHETTQIVGKEKFDFDDAEVSRQMVMA